MAFSVCRQKCVTGYPQCPRHDRTSKRPPLHNLFQYNRYKQLIKYGFKFFWVFFFYLFGHNFPVCFLRALSQIAGRK